MAVFCLGFDESNFPGLERVAPVTDVADVATPVVDRARPIRRESNRPTTELAILKAPGTTLEQTVAAGEFQCGSSRGIERRRSPRWMANLTHP